MSIIHLGAKEWKYSKKKKFYGTYSTGKFPVLLTQPHCVYLANPWRGSASIGFSKSPVEDKRLWETHTGTSDSQDWHSWKIEKVATGGWVKLEINNGLVME